MVLDERYSALQRELSGLINAASKVLILGIGENRMGDDGAGQYISFGLDKFNKSAKFCIINGGITPEERLADIIAFRPQLILIVDVIDIPGPKGAVNVFSDDKMLNYLPISSHSMPLPVFVDRIQRNVPGVLVKLVGIKPFSLEFLDRYSLFEEETYGLDAKEANPNIPFYSFNLTPEMEIICKDLIALFTQLLK